MLGKGQAYAFWERERESGRLKKGGREKRKGMIPTMVGAAEKAKRKILESEVAQRKEIARVMKERILESEVAQGKEIAKVMKERILESDVEWMTPMVVVAVVMEHG